MRYYKDIQNGVLVIGAGLGGEEISREEYMAIAAEIREKCEYIEQLCAGEITADEVPERWREEAVAVAQERARLELTEQTSSDDNTEKERNDG